MFKEAQIPTFNHLKALHLFVCKHGKKNAPCACTLINPSSIILSCFRSFSLISLLPTSLFFITKMCNSSTLSPKWHFHICFAHTAAQIYNLTWINETLFKGEAENCRRIAGSKSCSDSRGSKIRFLIAPLIKQLNISALQAPALVHVQK